MRAGNGEYTGLGTRRIGGNAAKVAGMSAGARVTKAELGSQRSEIGCRKVYSPARGRFGVTSRHGRDGGDSAPIDFAAVADAEEMKRVLIDIHGVDDAIIADAQPTAVRAFQSV